jgi:hypothetical protein
MNQNIEKIIEHDPLKIRHGVVGKINTYQKPVSRSRFQVAELQYQEYSPDQYEPQKNTDRYIGLGALDISGAAPKKLLDVKGRKRLDFFPDHSVMNDFFNKETG